MRLGQAMAGRKVAEVSKAIGVSEASFYKWLEGRFEPGLAKLAMLASITNVSLDWLIAGRGPVRPDEQPGYIAPSWPGERPPLLFELDWFRKNIGAVVIHADLMKGIAPLEPEQFDAPHLFKVPDDSMEPALRSGDLVLAQGLPGAAGEAPTNGIYLVWFRDRALTDEEIAALLKLGRFPQRTFPRRIEWSEDSFLVKCDNAAAYPEPIKVPWKKFPDTVVAWRVVWHGRII